MSDKYAVMGNPISHSLSPFIHALFAKQTHQDMSYKAIQVPFSNFSEYVLNFVNEGGLGLNITLPFKQEAFQLVNQSSDRASLAKAVNTIIVKSPTNLVGDNTDGIGIIRDLTENHHIKISNKKILVIGAGGAVRGIIDPLLQQHPSCVVITNRTLATAKSLAREFSNENKVTALGFDEISNDYDIIINGTSVGLDKQEFFFPDHLINHHTFYYDMMYGKPTTPFLNWLSMKGITHFTDGLGMLVEQAAESFFLWRHVRPDTSNVLIYLRNEFIQN